LSPGLARAADAEIRFVQYDGNALPFADESFDKVVTSLVLHHLSPAEKHAAFKEIYRVLKKGGEFHILDFGVQKSGYAKWLARF
jgi:ubiquinone/menaquinone biosynthesis C-methylase UbiE